MKQQVKTSWKSLSETWISFVITGIFAVAMGFLEAIVVVYLRQIYYPDGFDFPLIMLTGEMLSVEWIREIATIIMLLAVGIMVGKNSLQRLFYFLYTFAIWDIFYYVALYLLLDWPASLLTWDLLFLIPVPWIGPVLAPVICSLTMIFMAFTLIIPQQRGKIIMIRAYEWVLIFGGGLVILFTYINDYMRLLIQSNVSSASTGNERIVETERLLATFVPSEYSWTVFFAGEALIIFAMFKIIRRIRSVRR